MFVVLIDVAFAIAPPISSPLYWVMKINSRRNFTTEKSYFNRALYWTFENYCISDTSDGHNQGEVDICASPVEEGRLVAVWHDFDWFSDYDYYINFDYALTTDNGDTWERNTLYHPAYPDTYYLGDPTITADNAGNFYIAALGFDEYFMEEISVLVFASRDSGRTFAELCTLAIDDPSVYFHDKEWIAADWNGAFPGNVYVVWQRFDAEWNTDIIFSRSTDYGHTFSAPAIIASTSGYLSPGISYCAVGPDGELYVSWALWDPSSDYPTPNQIQCIRSDDGGETFSEPFDVVSASIIADSLGRYDRANGFPIISVDGTSDERRGWVYITYASWEDSARRADVFCVHSTDGGASWSDPVLVNDVTDGDQFMPWVDIDEFGNVNIIFYDTRDNLSTGWCDVYFAQSTDGGEIFSANSRVSSESFDPYAQFMGDYINIDYSAGKLFPIWTDTRLGYEHIFVGIGEEDKIKSEQTKPQDIAITAYPNPFNTSCTLILPDNLSSGAELAIYDFSGKSISHWRLADGQRKIAWNANGFPSGIYFAKICGTQKTKKLLLVR